MYLKFYTTPEDYDAVEAALADAGIETEVAKITMIPDTTIELTGDDAVKMQKMLDVLDDLDDVQKRISQRYFARRRRRIILRSTLRGAPFFIDS